ncbi:hypothetical protein SHIRM173S_12088 [Streptomyces hirsutus]
MPRLREPQAPLLAVVGGSTGAGKSTPGELTRGAARQRGGRAAANNPDPGARLPPPRTTTGSAGCACCPTSRACGALGGNSTTCCSRERTRRASCASRPPTGAAQLPGPPASPCGCDGRGSRSCHVLAGGPFRRPAYVDRRRAHRVQLERRRRGSSGSASPVAPAPVTATAGADEQLRGRPSTAGPRLGGRAAPRTGGPGAGPGRRRHLGRRPGEVRRRDAARALSAAHGGPRGGDVRRPQPDRPAARGGRRTGPGRSAPPARRGRHRPGRVRRTRYDGPRAVRAHRRRGRRTA